MTRVLVLNGGTGTVKAAVARVAAGEVVVEARHVVEVAADGGDRCAFEAAMAGLGAALANVTAVGHRVVHGGTELTRPVRVDAAVEATIARLAPLAPLHNRIALAGITAARARYAALPMVAVFDTAFHAGRPEPAQRYALPEALVASHGLRRYGFHGIAHASLVAGLAAALGVAPTAVDAVTLQLGSGCSACAVAGGRSIETSMGFTPLEGLVMGTRAGDVDPGLVIHLHRAGLSPDALERVLTRESGLRGVGGSADVRELLRREAAGDARAALALALFVRRIVMTVGSYLTLLDGRGALVFGGGIGEHAGEIRARVAAGLRAWNVALDPARNAAPGPSVRALGAAGARPVWVVPTDEESLIAAAVIRVLAEEP
ncbi:MAG: hypothetical protein B6D46_10295 [Polyangiaceae bacterium UTPRO1]|jgi:acetate kinase|nr:propionate/acetate kinase [Myxococcales bacterium]OQY66553.1 MAG: hypothetical protein B6D46_10295 [Polyangiaceae bacterium UTPRO1]